MIKVTKRVLLEYTNNKDSVQHGHPRSVCTSVYPTISVNFGSGSGGGVQRRIRSNFANAQDDRTFVALITIKGRFLKLRHPMIMICIIISIADYEVHA